MLLSFDKPKKIMTEEDRINTYVADSCVPGAYVSNMSDEDNEKWKGKYIGGIDPRIEIRRYVSEKVIGEYLSRNSGPEALKTSAQVLIKVRLNGDVVISTNGKIGMTGKSYSELLQVIEEARDVLRSKV